MFVAFFVAPVGGTLATLLTQKYIEISAKISQAAADVVYGQCQVFGLSCMAIILLLQIGALQIPLVQHYVGNKFAGLEISYILILFPIALLSFLSVINASVLTARKNFTTFTALPALVPLSIIITLLMSPKEFLFAGLVLGTVAGYLLEFVFGLVCLRKILLSVTYQSLKTPNTGFIEIIRSMRLMFISGIIMSCCLLVDQFMAILAGDGAVAIINYGNRVTLGLISIIAIFWTVLYPNFVSLAVSENFSEIRATLWRFAFIGVVCLLPLCGLIAYFSEDLIALLFERGAFIQSDTQVVAKVQTFYLMHIPLYFLCMICMRIANALENSKITLFGSALSLFLNILLNLLFLKHFGVIGISLATLVAYSFMALFWLLVANRLIARAEAVKVF